MVFIGIDPGKAGGIAAIDSEGVPKMVRQMPETESDILMLLRQISDVEQAHAIMEFVSSTPQMGVRSAFTFGRGYGVLRMGLLAARIPFDLVSPLKWQAVMRCRSGGDKNVTKRRAQELFPFPGLRITHMVADALLLAEYGRRVKLGIG